MNRSSHTHRFNLFDIKCVGDTPIYVDENGIEHSLNKDRNWELLDDPTISQIKYHRGVDGEPETTAITNKQNWHGGGSFYHFKRGRDFVSVDGVKQNQSFDQQTHTNCIFLPFSPNEYPINHEPHVLHESPCPCCFQRQGRIWELRGLGDKSVSKNKGMRKQTKKDLKFYHDFS